MQHRHTQLKIMQHRQSNRQLRHFIRLQCAEPTVVEGALSRVVGNAAVGGGVTQGEGDGSGGAHDVRLPA